MYTSIYFTEPPQNEHFKVFYWAKVEIYDTKLHVVQIKKNQNANLHHFDER